jgi:hypothetical protein
MTGNFNSSTTSDSRPVPAGGASVIQPKDGVIRIMRRWRERVRRITGRTAGVPGHCRQALAVLGASLVIPIPGAALVAFVILLFARRNRGAPPPTGAGP